MKTDYNAMRQSQANRPRILKLIDMAEAAEDCDAPPMVYENPAFKKPAK